MFLKVILPLFLLAGVGFLLGRYRHVGARRPTNAVLYLFLPVLMFTSLVRNPLGAAEAGRYVTWYWGYLLCAWSGAYLVARLRGWDRPTRSAVALGLTGLNCGSYGAPVVLFALGEGALSGAMLLVALSNISAGSVGVYIAAGGTRSSLQALASVFRLPLIYALLLALIVHGLDLHLPEQVLTVGHAVGMGGPMLALVVLGIQLAGIDVRGGQLRLVAGVTLAKLLGGPALGIGLAAALGARGVAWQTLLIYSCMPTAINGLLLAVRYGAHPELLGGILVGTTVLSPLTITAVLALFGPG